MSLRSRSTRPYGTLTVLACLTLSGAASAAALNGLVPTALAVGSAPITTCDTDGFTVAHVLTGSIVTAVTVGAISSTCEGGVLQVTLTDGTGALVATGGPATVPAGGEVTVSLSPTPDVTAFTDHRIRVVGP